MITVMLLTLAACFTTYQLTGSVTAALLVWAASGIVLVVLDNKILGGK